MAIAEITQDNLAALSKGLSAIFDRERLALLDKQDYKKFVSQTVKSPTSSIVEIQVGSDIPELLVWDQSAGRTIQLLGSSTKEFKTKPYEATIEVKENDILFEQLDVIKNRVSNLPLAENLFKKKEALKIIGDVTASTSYDGKALYGKHVVRFMADKGGAARTPVQAQATYTNTAEGVLDNATIGKALADMMSQKDVSGNILTVEPNTIFVSTDLYAEALQLIDVPTGEMGASNPFYKRFEVIVNTNLKDGSFVLADLRLSPAVEVVTRDLRFRSGNEISNYAFFNKGELQYGIDSQFIIGCGMYEGVYLVTKKA